MTVMRIFTVLFLFTGVFHQNVLSSPVPETTVNYDCSDAQHNLMSEDNFTNCELTWTVEGSPKATFSNGSKECHRPCIEVKSGGIVIDACVNITLTAFCIKEYVMEYRTHFRGMLISPLPLKNPQDRTHYGVWVCLALLLSVALGLMFQCYRSRNSNLNQV